MEIEDFVTVILLFYTDGRSRPGTAPGASLTWAIAWPRPWRCPT